MKVKFKAGDWVKGNPKLAPYYDTSANHQRLLHRSFKIQSVSANGTIAKLKGIATPVANIDSFLVKSEDPDVKKVFNKLKEEAERKHG